MVVLIAFEWTQRAPQSFRLKDLAFRNMSCMLFTLEMSHFEMSPLNDLAPLNIRDMSLTFDTSHRAMEQSQLYFGNCLGNCLPQLLMACLSSDMDRGENPCGGEAEKQWG